MPIDPSNDPNEAYELTHPPGDPHDLPSDWWTVTCNGIPVRHFSPDRKAEAERYMVDPVWRAELAKSRMFHDRKPQG